MKISFTQKKLFVSLILITLTFLPQTEVGAWTEHTLTSYPILSSMPLIRDAEPVKVESLEAFLVAEGEKLETLLQEQETWSIKNLQWYAPRPEVLIFKASADAGEARLRFFHAIRINPNVIVPLYLQLIPGQSVQDRPLLPASDITFIKDKSDIRNTIFVKLREGEPVAPLDVVNTATNEPDLGLDIGLFEDNNTEFGKIYGFGIQPFGNPNLEFGSQAPFHMGFYHESGIIYTFAAFLKRTCPEYRIQLYKRLSEFAFQTGHDYWGWRFAGWGLHYLADLAQPYHATVLPGVSTAKALWINSIDMIGLHGAKENAVQLVSNRHLALEKFQQMILRKAFQDNQKNDFIIKALYDIKDVPVYDDTLPRDIVAKAAHARSAETDKILRKNMPHQFVSDPGFEFGTSEEQFEILEKIRADKGVSAIENLSLMTAELLSPLPGYYRSYVTSIHTVAGVKR